jgi:hypothetical protein
MSPGPVDRRAVLAVLAFGSGALAGGAAGTAIASASSPQSSGPATTALLQGIVVAEPPPTGTAVSVKIDGGGVESLPYLAGYVPVPGDTVAVSIFTAGGNTTRMVMGGHSGRSGNLVVNGDFARIPPLKSAAAPYMWYQHRIAGKTTKLVAMISPRYQKPMMLLDSHPETTGDNIAYSAAFPVKPGETIKGDAAVFMDIVPPMSVQVDLRVAFFADAAQTYPQVLKEAPLFGLTFNEDGENLLEGTVAVPAGAVAARVGIRARHSGGQDGQYTLYVGHVYAAR